MITEQQAYQAINDFLSEVIGEEFIDEYEIEMASTLTGDLEMESIEIVELSEKIRTKYGAEVDMPSWLAELSLEQLVKLTVGDVTKFLQNAVT